MSYANPVRLYLIVSLFFFFIFSGVGKKIISDDDDGVHIAASTDSKGTKLDNLEEITAEDLKDLKEVTGKGFRPIMRSLSRKDKKKVIDRLGVEVAAQYHLKPKDTIIRKRTKKDGAFDDDFLSDSKFNWSLFNKELKENKDISDQQVYDSIYIGKASDLEQLVARQRVKVERTEIEYFVGYALKNLPIMMFLLLPIFALILKLLYVRRKVLYIRHLVHALHLHAFAYLTYGVTLLITFYWLGNGNSNDSNELGDWINFLAFILVSTYSYISFLKVYKQHWFKTLIKFNIHGILYATFLMLFFSGSMALSFLLF